MNVLVSALIASDTPPARVIDAWLAGRVTLLISVPLLGEVLDVLARPRVQRFFRRVPGLLETITERLKGEPQVPSLEGGRVSRDVDDDPVLAAAVAGHADYIVSGDEDLLVLGEHEGIPTLTPARFLAILEEPDPSHSAPG